MQNNNNNFLDSRTLLAIGLSALVFVLYSSYLNKKYPKPTQTAQQEEVLSADETKEPNTSPATQVANNDIAKSAQQEEESSEIAVEKTQVVVFDDEYLKLEIAARGMGLQLIQLKKYNDRNHNFKIIGHSEESIPFETSLIGKRSPLYFNVIKKSENVFEGTASYRGMTIVKTLEVDSKSYTINTNVSVMKPTESFEGIKTILSQKVVAPEQTGFLPGSRFDASQLYISYGTNDERELILHDESVSGRRFNKVTIASLDEQYFAQSIVDKSSLIPDVLFNSTVKDGDSENPSAYATAAVLYPVIDAGKAFKASYLSFVGPKSYDLLEGIDSNLANIIDYGFFSFIAHPLLSLLKWFYQIFSNWGYAIIALTLVVRFLLLPLHLTSYKSMRNMSKLSPLLKEINEKYKDDPQVRGQKMMELYKEYKVNPVSGCLPMILQIPVFFALYQVIGQSIELYQAPFIFWIHDLSIADPYYILPLLMGVTMFFQMKLTPSTMDPKQAKIMMFMPVLFTFFMLPLPSGLTLYFFISGLFGIIQQYSLKDRTTDTNAKVITVK